MSESTDDISPSARRAKQSARDKLEKILNDIAEKDRTREVEQNALNKGQHKKAVKK